MVKLFKYILVISETNLKTNFTEGINVAFNIYTKTNF